MGTQNSRIEILLGVIRNLLDDLLVIFERSPSLRDSIPFNLARECARDYLYIESRVLSEGLPFLTGSLPRLGKWFDQKLAERDGALIEGFKPYTKLITGNEQVACPLFMRVYAYVIHCVPGMHQERAEVIRLYRSLLFLFYKLEVPLTTSQLDNNLLKWKTIELELTLHEYPSYYDQVAIQLREYISRIMDDAGYCFEIDRPRHGPGAVAGGEKGDEKWECPKFLTPLHLVYPWYDIYLGYRSNGRISDHMAGEYLNLVKGRGVHEATSRLLFVPKDSRGPRTISCEPKELMFLQQSVCHKLMAHSHSKSHGEINFVDQSINQRAACEASTSQRFATVDLADASDRISMMLVRLLFPDWTLKYLLALRSIHTLLPDGTLYRHHAKYAPMGSALCFPVESILFWAIAKLSNQIAGVDPTEPVYVYGDDIIIHPSAVRYFNDICSELALKVNLEKTFTEGPFRESCGFDAWNGENVTAFRIKKDIGSRSLDGPLATAICQYSSTCFALNYRRTGEFLLACVDSVYPGVIRDYRTQACLHVVDPFSVFDQKSYKCRNNRDLCRLEVKGWVVFKPKKASNLNSVTRFHKNTFGSWELHDPSQVVDQRPTKIRKRYVAVEWAS